MSERKWGCVHDDRGGRQDPSGDGKIRAHPQKQESEEAVADRHQSVPRHLRLHRLLHPQCHPRPQRVGSHYQVCGIDSLSCQYFIFSFCSSLSFIRRSMKPNVAIIVGLSCFSRRFFQNGPETTFGAESQIIQKVRLFVHLGLSRSVLPCFFSNLKLFFVGSSEALCDFLLWDTQKSPLFGLLMLIV